jgi:hypothetical protein
VPRHLTGALGDGLGGGGDGGLCGWRGRGRVRRNERTRRISLGNIIEHRPDLNRRVIDEWTRMIGSCKNAVKAAQFRPV